MRIFILLLISLGVVGCRKSQHSGELFMPSGNISVSDSLLRITPPMRKGEISFDSIIDNVSYIPLATGDSVLISSITDVKMLDDVFYILDAKGGKVFAYDESGAFMGKIDALGEGPEQYKRIYSFDIDRKNKLLYLLDSDLGKVHVYGTSLQLLNVIDLPYKFVDHIALYDESTFLLEFGFREYSKSDVSPNLVLYDFRKQKTLESYFYYENGEVRYRNQSPIAFSSYKDNVYYWTSLGNLVYRCSDASFEKVMECDFGVYITPSGIYTETRSEATKLMNENGYAYIDRFYEYRDWYYVSISRMNTSAHYFYSKKKHKGFLDVSFMNIKDQSKVIVPELFPLSDSVCCGYISAERYLALDEDDTMNLTSIEDNPILIVYELKR